MTRGSLPGALAAVALLTLLTGCVAQPTFPSPPPATDDATEQTALPSPSPSPTAPAVASAERVVIDSEHITVLADDASELARFDYFQPTHEVVAGLSSYLGAPVDTWFEGHGEAPPATYHEWGGLRLVDTVPEGEAPFYPEHWVRVTSTDANGLFLSTADGVAVGDDVEVLIPAADDLYRWTTPETGAAMVSFRIDLIELPDLPGADPNSSWSPSFGVVVVGDDAAGVVTFLSAPSANFGA